MTADSTTDASDAVARASDPAGSVARLLDLLDVSPLGDDRFLGQSTDAGWQRVYGGQVVAQALMAASKTIDDGRLCHSLHAYFIRAGDPGQPIVYRVERDRDGRSFTTRRIVAIQQGRPIFNMAASFQIEEAGLEHAFPAPPAPPPETLLSDAELTARYAADTPEPYRTLWLKRERPIEFRPTEPLDPFHPVAHPPRAQFWCRAAAPVNVTPPVARALLAYASDMTLLDTCLLPHAVAWTDPALQVASLDHAIWFHMTPDMNGWLLFDQDSPVASGGRGLNRALVSDRAGKPVASLMQEGLMRYRAK